MAHILEFISKDKKFTASEVIEEQITNLLTRMADCKYLIETDEVELAKTIESWRNELFFIRCAVNDVLREE
jgi:hypothetical protein